MSRRITDEEIARILRAAPEAAVPPMAPLRLPPRPRPMPRLPWRGGELMLLWASAGLGLGGIAWLALSGPGAVFAGLVQLFFGPGGLGGTVCAAAFAAAVGWLVVVLAAPRAA